MTRSLAAQRFIRASGWGDAEITKLAGDASHRRYDRLRKADGSTAVLMDAPPETGEDVRPFVAIAGWLAAQGLSAPRILAKNAMDGFLLIEDLGDDLFAREMAKDDALQRPLYAAAVDVLVHTHKAKAPDLSPYNSDVSVPLSGLAFDWYQSGALDYAVSISKTAFLEAFRPLVASFDGALDVLVQRDFHAENLLWLPDRTGVARVGLLDFQDAMLGHRAYDLVSIVQDARRDVAPDLADMMIQRYVGSTGVDPVTFHEAFAVFGLQRNLRILGVFARLCLRDGKAHYVELIPRVWAHLQANLEHETTSGLRPFLMQALPAPEDAVLTTLKGKCGAWAGR